MSQHKAFSACKAQIDVSKSISLIGCNLTSRSPATSILKLTSESTQQLTVGRALWAVIKVTLNLCEAADALCLREEIFTSVPAHKASF